MTGVKRVLFVVNDSWFFKSHRLPIAISAMRDGYEVHLCAKQDDTTDYISSLGVTVYPWNLSPRSLNPIRECIGFYGLLKCILKVRPHILHLVTIKSVLYGGIIARLVRVPAVVFAISGRGYIFSSEGRQQGALKKFARSVYRFVLGHRNASLLVQNSADFAYFKDSGLISADSISLIPGSGVDLNFFKPEKKAKRFSEPLVLFASRMLWDKGVKEFVEAAKLVNKDELKCKFILAGAVDSENPRSVPEDWLVSLPNGRNIEWIGKSDEIKQLIRDCSIVVLPTTYGEGVPKILIEAAASGRAIVTTNWPGCVDVVKDKYNGLVVEPKDIVSLAGSIDWLIENPNVAEVYGKNGRALALESLSIERVIADTLAIYSDLLKSYDER